MTECVTEKITNQEMLYFSTSPISNCFCTWRNKKPVNRTLLQAHACMHQKTRLVLGEITNINDNGKPATAPQQWTVSYRYLKQ